MCFSFKKVNPHLRIKREDNTVVKGRMRGIVLFAGLDVCRVAGDQCQYLKIHL